MWTVGVSTENGLELAEPRLLFERRYEAMPAIARPFYDVAADGRLLMVQSSRGSQATQIEVVLGWLGELERRLAED